MPGAFISFADGAGAAQLDNGMTGIAGGVGSHFVNWVSESEPIGPAKNALGTGALTMFAFRTEYRATFELQEIPNSNTAILDRLIAWLLTGGTCSVTCADSTSAVFAACGLAPGFKPKKTLMDRSNITWKVTLSLINLAGSPAPMTCIYSS